MQKTSNNYWAWDCATVGCIQWFQAPSCHSLRLASQQWGGKRRSVVPRRTKHVWGPSDSNGSIEQIWNIQVQGFTNPAPSPPFYRMSQHARHCAQISPSSCSAAVASTVLWTSFLSWRFFAYLDAFLRCFSSKITDARIDSCTLSKKKHDGTVGLTWHRPFTSYISVQLRSQSSTSSWACSSSGEGAAGSGTSAFGTWASGSMKTG